MKSVDEFLNEKIKDGLLEFRNGKPVVMIGIFKNKRHFVEIHEIKYGTVWFEHKDEDGELIRLGGLKESDFMEYCTDKWVKMVKKDYDGIYISEDIINNF